MSDIASSVYPNAQGGATQAANPWFQISNQFLPRNLKDTIRWSKYIIVQSPIIAETMRKYATYPITNLTIDTTNKALKAKYEHLLKSLRLKESLMNIGFEYFTQGNSFISLYTPILRMLTCPSCKVTTAARSATHLAFKKYAFVGDCKLCKAKNQTFTRTDEKSLNIDDMNVILWDPLCIVVNHNPITGEKEYYYKIPQSLKNKIAAGDRLLVDTLPWNFIEAAKANQDFKFDKDSIYHLMNMTTGASVEGVAVPPILSLYSLVFYQATLRKANEAVSAEYLNPLRVVFPQAQSANSDPVVAMSMRNFVGNMKDAFIRHKTDPNHIAFAPVPVGYQAIGGEGKALLVSQEIQQAEETILLALGVSRELLSGSTNWNSTSIGLRMMDSLLTGYTSRMGDLIDWITNKSAAYLNIDPVDIKLVPFKLVDDDNFKTMLSGLAQAGKASYGTLYSEIGLDYQKEQDKVKAESVQAAKLQVETTYEVEQAQFMASRDVSENMSENEEYKSAVQKAQGMAEQLTQVDEGTKRSFLNKLKLTDYGQYLMVSKLLDDYNKSQQHQVENQNGVNQVASDQVQAGNTSATPTAPDAPGE